MNSVPKSSRIYKITCTANGKFYVGSTDNFRRRWSVHLRELRGQYHHSIYLQRSFNKYGETSLTFEVLEFVMPFALIDREDYWLKKLHPFGDSGLLILMSFNLMFGSVLMRHSMPSRARAEASHLYASRFANSSITLDSSRSSPLKSSTPLNFPRQCAALSIVATI